MTRESIERYAKIWNLSWSEDSSNCKDKYTRNRIRNELIPWIKENVNAGIVKTLCQ
jgi:tRNA(Ile)-lysidine synthase